MPNSLAYTEFTKGQRIYKGQRICRGTESLQRDSEIPEVEVPLICRMYMSRHDFELLHAEASGGLEADIHTPVSVQGSAQGDAGMPPVLSGASSSLSSPLRESGHLESLLEVNSRVEAAVDRAHAQLQAGLPLFLFLFLLCFLFLRFVFLYPCAFFASSVFVPPSLQHPNLPLTAVPWTALSSSHSAIDCFVLLFN